MTIKYPILLIILISVISAKSQGYRLPDWSKLEYSWEGKPTTQIIIDNKKLFRIENLISLNLNDTTYKYTEQQLLTSDPNIFGRTKTTIDVGNEFSGKYFVKNDTLNLLQKDSIIHQFKYKRKNLLTINDSEEKKFNFATQGRIAFSIQYDLPIAPYSFASEIFIIHNKNIFIGINTSIFIHYLTFGGYIGLQKKFFITQLGVNHTSLINRTNFFSITPKVGLVYKNIFIKVGTILPLDSRYIDAFKPINFELGYYFKI